MTNPTYYAGPDISNGKLADSWFWSMGDRWIAVVAADMGDNWFAHLDQTAPAIRQHPIDKEPPFGTLVYWTKDGEQQQKHLLTRYADDMVLDMLSDWLTQPDAEGHWGSACDFIEFAADAIRKTGRDVDPAPEQHDYEVMVTATFTATSPEEAARAMEEWLHQTKDVAYVVDGPDAHETIHL